jgi:hypothetical protein
LQIIKLSLFTLGFLFYFSTPSASGEIFDKPVYDGDVEETTEPIEIRYRPFSRSRYFKTEEKSGTGSGGPMTVKANVIGYISCDSDDDNLVTQINIEKLEGQGGGRVIEKAYDLHLTIKHSDTGEIIDLKVTGNDKPKDVDSLGFKSNSIREMFGAFVQIFPSSGVETGDQLFTDDSREKQRNFGLDLSSIVQGVTEYNGRQSIIANVEGTMNLFGDAKGDMEGYYIIDVETGVVAYSETVMEFKPNSGEMFSGKETARIEF